MYLYAILGLAAMRPASVVPIKTMMALRHTLDVGSAESLQTDDRDLIFRAGFSTVSVRVQRTDAESPMQLERQVAMMRSSQKIAVLDLREVPADVDLFPLLTDIRNRWQDQDKIVFFLRSVTDVPMVRGIAPSSTLILPVDDLRLDSTPVLPDGNIVYAFGSIGPAIFQNQPTNGSVGSGVDDRRAMFPPDPDRIRQTTQVDPDLRDQMRKYGQEKWSVMDVRDRLQKWVDWGRRNRRYVWWTGLGCSAGAEEASRRRYFETMARAASHFDLGWCLSSYQGDWAVAKGAATSRSMRSETAAVFSSE